MDGQIEVFVWEDQLKRTEDLWVEGRIVTVAGTVRLREDQVSISCIAAEEFSPDRESQEPDQPQATIPPESSPELDPPAPLREEVPEIADEDAPYETANVTANGASAPTTETSDPPTIDSNQSPSLAHSKVAVPQRLNLRLTQTDSAVDDQMMLDDLKRILLEYTGTDEVTLEISADGHIYRMEWPPIRVTASDELAGKLNQVLGESGSVMLEAAAR